ncbi:Hypothetical protein SRAE_2000384000 [Strongyloides ratti]|uniref:Uncharacterized protein n=1 Tax=Strongyloides ratti TaxID=34506 RepID=A0A090LNX1_STRRB|nr:Hypothetical protein SRAE_2000384000 [Strongyloides ratti]CEF69190.1 Hypothetical protein SRAE_2000384000 [Strongyloides ratti]
MYKNLKVKIVKFIDKTKQNYRNKELQFLRRNHQRSTNELHKKLETYKPLATLYENDGIEEVSKNNLNKENKKIHFINDKSEDKDNLLDKYKKKAKFQKVFNNIFGTTVVCDFIATDITF